jgi:shikimate dehydrogenase
VAGLGPEWRGLSLTMPLKRAVLAVATESREPVPTIGVANTLVLDRGRRVAHNTDVGGMQAALAGAGVTTVDKATVIGSGATAVAAVAALHPIAATIVCCARSVQRAATAVAVGERLGARVSVVDWDHAPAHLSAPVVVSTTPASSTDEWVGVVPERPGLLFDVVYEPWPTPFAAAWMDAGGAVLGGLDLLVHQAVGQIEVMTGHRVAVPLLRQALERS